MKKKIAIVVVIAVLSGFAYTKKSNGETEKTDLPSYPAYKVKVSNLDKYVEASGIVEAKSTKSIYIDKALKVKNLYFEEGDYIKKGELIMTFDDEERNSILRKIEKQEIEIKKLERDYNNAKELYELGGSTKNDIEDLEYDIKEAKLTLEEYQEELAKTVETVTSPFEGTIIAMTAEENYRVNTEEELLEVADLSDIKITAEVPEYDLNNVKVGQEVRIMPEVFEKKQTITGHVASIANISSDSSDDTEAYVEVSIEIDDDSYSFLPGFTADVEIVYQNKKNVVFVPRTALVSDGENIYAYVIDKDNITSKKTVETGMTNNDSIEVTSGLADGDRILLNVDKGLAEGIEINPTRPAINTGKGQSGRPGGGTGAGPGR